MNKVILFLAVIGVTNPVWAVDPIIGTWKLNLAESKFPATEVMPKERTEIYRELDVDLIEFEATGTEANGSPISFKATWPQQGGTVDILQGGNEETSYIETLIEPGDWYVTVLQNGKQVGVIHKTFSQDGKRMRQTYTSTDAQGNPFERLSVYDRQ
ncbi:MAG: hypothetical protein JW896_06085 [Deltaproteobacteria bacterium]|nr:hypothetical protein [Deltaproteobacteria bacterium]